MPEPQGTGFQVAHDSITHAGVSEYVAMNRWHFLLVLERAGKYRCPRLEWVLIPLGIFLGIWFVILTSDFKDTMGVSKATWEALALLLSGLTGVASVVLFVWWVGDLAWHAFLHPKKTPDELVEEVIAQMERDRAKLVAPPPTPDAG